MNVEQIDLEEFYFSDYSISDSEVYSEETKYDLVDYLWPIWNDDLFTFVYACYQGENGEFREERENLMTIELFDYSATFTYFNGKYIIGILTHLKLIRVDDPKELQKYIMFLELVEFHLRELNS